MQVINTASKQLNSRYPHPQSDWSSTAVASATQAQSGGMLVQPDTSNTTTVETDLCLVPRSINATSPTSWRPLTTPDTFSLTHSRPATDTDPCQVPDCPPSEPAGSHAALRSDGTASIQPLKRRGQKPRDRMQEPLTKAVI